jgi:CheY-like chemotaxis protein
MLLRASEGSAMPLRGYEIRVKGVAGPAVGAAFRDFDIVTEGANSVWRGKVRDQAALFGVLHRIQSLGVELLDVRAVDQAVDQAVNQATDEPVSVLLVNRQPAVQDELWLLVGEQVDLVVVGRAATVGEAIAAAVRPRVVVTEVDLADERGPEVVRALRSGIGPAAILVLSAIESPPDVQAVIRAGADGYLVHPAQPAELLHAIRSVADGGTYLQPSVGPMASGG